MRICQVGTGFVPLAPGATGGAERFVHYLSQTLQRLGHEVTVVDMASRPQRRAPYRLIELRLRWSADFSLLAHALRGLLFGWAVSKRLAQLLREERFDIVNFHSQFSGLVATPVARRLNVPAFFTMHNALWSDEAACRSPWTRAKFWMERRAESQADRRIYLSEAVKENRRRFFGLEPAALHMVPLGIDESWFAPIQPGCDTRRKYAPQGEAVVLQVARIAPYKNQITLIQALPHILRGVPGTRVVLVGPQDSPGYLARLREAAVQVGVEDSVVFAGALSPEELAELYGLARAFVLPSLQENFPQSLLEAMAQSIPVVASDIEPLRPILQGVAHLVPPTDHRALARAALALLEAPEAARRTAETARCRVWDRYRWGVVAQQTVDVYQAHLSAPLSSARRERGHSLVEGHL